MNNNEQKKQRGKRSYLFELIMLCIVCFMAFCACGCASCGIKSAATNGGYKLSGCTLPGCGGCLSSGRGCNCSLYSENISCFTFEPDENSNEQVKNPVSINACDNVFLGGCMGCGSNEHHTSCGYIKAGQDNPGGCFYYQDANQRGCSKSDGSMTVCGSGGCTSVKPEAINMGNILDIIKIEFGLK